MALPGTEREPSWARPCEASGALFLSNGGSGGGHETCTLWPPPAPFGYFSRAGKVPRPARRRTKPPTRNRFLVDGKEKPYLAFPVTQRVSPLRRRPKGFPLALWKPSAPYLLKLFQAKKPKVFSSFLSMKKRVFYSPLHHQPSWWFSFRKKSAPRTISCEERLFLTSNH